METKRASRTPAFHAHRHLFYFLMVLITSPLVLCILFPRVFLFSLSSSRVSQEEYDTRSIFLSCPEDFLEMGISPEDVTSIANWAKQVEMAEVGN